MIPALLGDGLILREVAQSLRSKRSIYLLSVRRRQRHRDAHWTIGEIAQACTEAICAEQATGPYALAGSGFGGLIAYEVACRLRARGQAVEMLGLIGVHFYADDRHAFSGLRHSLWAIRSRFPIHRVRSLHRWPAYLLAALRTRSMSRPDETANHLSASEIDIYEEIAAYKPPRYDGRVSVFRSSPGCFGADGPLSMLRRAAAAVEVYDFWQGAGGAPARGLDFALAEQLDRCLGSADAGDNRGELRNPAGPVLNVPLALPPREPGEKGACLTQLFARLAGRESRIDARKLAIVVAHPDDETIGIGGQLNRLEKASIVHLTNGAPRDLRYARAAGFATRAAYSAVRRAEFERAMAEGEAQHVLPMWFNIDDQALAVHLAEAARALARLFANLGTEIVLTHPYEGGHPDHDAAALAVRAAAALVARAGMNPPDIGEMTFYHPGSSDLVIQQFVPEPNSSEVAVALDERVWNRKQRMVAQFRSQRDTVEPFNARFERFRHAPSYDFGRQPNQGAMQYDFKQWRYVVRVALAELGLTEQMDPQRAGILASAAG
jgi:LmbE family N-acetylglucosaminyl deacetylase